MLWYVSNLILKSLAHKCEAFLCTGSTVFRKEPGMAVRLYPGMDGMSQGAMEGGETNVHGWTVFRKKPGKAVQSLQFT